MRDEKVIAAAVHILCNLGLRDQEKLRVAICQLWSAHPKLFADVRRARKREFKNAKSGGEEFALELAETGYCESEVDYILNITRTSFMRRAGLAQKKINEAKNPATQVTKRSTN